MASLAAHLVDDVLGGLPVRQLVLTTPHRLRYALACDQRLCRRVLAVFIRAVLSVTAIQRFGSGANLNVHFHSLVAQGVFADDGARFVPLPAPSDRDVWRVLATVRRRVVRLARRHGIDVEGDASSTCAGTFFDRRSRRIPSRSPRTVAYGSRCAGHGATARARCCSTRSTFSGASRP